MRRLSRRMFLTTGLAGSAAAVTLPALHIPSTTPPEPVRPIEPEERTIGTLQQELRAGRTTIRAITKGYLARIEAIDRSGPALNSVIELNPDALKIADELDAEWKAKGPRGPLHGIPILLKDNIDTGDSMATTAGSLALVGSRPPGDASFVKRLREKGALILGKTNLSEWANIRSNHSTSGWSGRGGLTRNPYALDRNTSGSSSGSAAAVAAGLCAAAVGTETDGSIVSPSSINGIVGIKPTVGQVSRTGVIPISHTQDTPGPMARTVTDAALLLIAMAGADPEDSATKGGKFLTSLPELNKSALRGARIGVVRKYFGFLPSVDVVMENALELLRKSGAVLVDPADIPTIGEFDAAEGIVLRYELKADLNAYLARLGPSAPVHTLAEIIRFNERNREKEMPYFGQESFLKAEALGPLTEKEYRDALARCRLLSRTKGIDAVLSRYRLDALVAPTESPAWVTDLVAGDHFLGGSSTGAAVAGYPSITVPAGQVFGLPVGISFFGAAWSEGKLIQLAYAFEQASNARSSPRFLPAVELKG